MFIRIKEHIKNVKPGDSSKSKYNVALKPDVVVIKRTKFIMGSLRCNIWNSLLIQFLEKEYVYK